MKLNFLSSLALLGLSLADHKVSLICLSNSTAINEMGLTFAHVGAGDNAVFMTNDHISYSFSSADSSVYMTAGENRYNLTAYEHDGSSSVDFSLLGGGTPVLAADTSMGFLTVNGSETFYGKNISYNGASSIALLPIEEPDSVPLQIQFIATD